MIRFAAADCSSFVIAITIPPLPRFAIRTLFRIFGPRLPFISTWATVHSHNHSHNHSKGQLFFNFVSVAGSPALAGRGLGEVYGGYPGASAFISCAHRHTNIANMPRYSEMQAMAGVWQGRCGSMESITYVFTYIGLIADVRSCQARSKCGEFSKLPSLYRTMTYT